jgi:hypothetical protein
MNGSIHGLLNPLADAAALLEHTTEDGIASSVA